MQSAVNIGSEDATNVVDAETLRGMVVSKEEIFERQKNGVLDSLFSTMVRIASEQGGTSYSANLNPQFDPKLLSTIVEKLESLGYKTSTEARTDEKLGAFVTLTINW